MSQARMEAKISELKAEAGGGSPTRRVTRTAGAVAAGSGSPGAPLGCSPDELAAAHAATNAARERTAQLEADLQRRQESYLRRERAYKVHIEEMEEDARRAPPKVQPQPAAAKGTLRMTSVRKKMMNGRKTKTIKRLTVVLIK